jgi:4-amino-4-deoxy-L-arabinose transferase-like glycosyltransferase
VAAGCVALYLLFFDRLADRDLWSSHEARAAMDAQSVLDGDWRLPHLYDGRAELQKPPLYYWLAALASAPRGAADAWAVRLPAALSALGGVLLLAAVGRRRGRPLAGIAAGLILATAIHFTWLARIARIDMPLSLTTALAVLCIHQAGRESRGTARLLLLLGYLAMAAGVLLKGPVGLILPGGVLVTNHFLDVAVGRRPAHSAFRIPHSALGLALVAALTLPWFVWANRHTGGEFFREFVWRHNVERGLGDGDLRSHPWWLYLPYFADDFLPWTPLLPLAAYLFVRRGWWRDDPDMRLGLVWLVVIVGGLSLSSFKRSDYLLPAYPGAALFLGCAAQRWRDEATRQGGTPAALAPLAPILVVLVAACAVAGWFVRVHWSLPRKEPFRDYTRFAAVVRRHAPAPAEVVFFRTEAHALAFHTGRPLRTLSDWDDLAAWLQSGGTRYVVLPPHAAAEAPAAVRGVRWEVVASNAELAGGEHERPLLLLRAVPP